jgi:hypothetical protein
VLVVTPPNRGTAALLYIHGGGMVVGSPQSEIRGSAALARREALSGLAPTDSPPKYLRCRISTAACWLTSAATCNCTRIRQECSAVRTGMDSGGIDKGDRACWDCQTRYTPACSTSTAS